MLSRTEQKKPLKSTIKQKLSQLTQIYYLVCADELFNVCRSPKSTFLLEALHQVATFENFGKLHSGIWVYRQWIDKLLIVDYSSRLNQIGKERRQILLKSKN